MGKIKTVFYAGPSIYGLKIKALSKELWRGPACCGDILRDTIRYRPKMIVLIDGVFHHSMSVWHKELVFALLQGVVCIGAASMGALRAAEMHRYGMIGVGKIFEMYRHGEEDDSLVALSFDPISFRPFSEPTIGHQQKRQDAMEAIEFARSYRGKVSTTLTAEAISPFMEALIMSTLNDIYGRRSRARHVTAD